MIELGQELAEGLFHCQDNLHLTKRKINKRMEEHSF